MRAEANQGGEGRSGGFELSQLQAEMAPSRGSTPHRLPLRDLLLARTSTTESTSFELCNPVLSIFQLRLAVLSLSCVFSCIGSSLAEWTSSARVCPGTRLPLISSGDDPTTQLWDLGGFIDTTERKTTLFTNSFDSYDFRFPPRKEEYPPMTNAPT